MSRDYSLKTISNLLPAEQFVKILERAIQTGLLILHQTMRQPQQPWQIQNTALKVSRSSYPLCTEAI